MFNPYIGCAVNPPQLEGDLVGHRLQGVEVVTEHHHGQVRTHTGDQFVEAQLDRLAEFEGIADLVGHTGLQSLNQRLLVQLWIRPLITRLEHDHTVGDVDRHGVDGCFRRTGAGEHGRHFRFSGDGLLQRKLHGQRLLQGG